jgi:hypothetical protein
MKKVYLILAIVGFVAPNILVVQESIESGNILLYRYPLATFQAMFANRISSIFSIDLLFGVVVFFIWTYKEGNRLGIQRIPLLWILTMLFGFGGGFPLYLYWRSQKLEHQNEG